MKYAWIKKQCEDYSAIALCQFMKVSGSCYYEWLHSPKTEREEENEKYIVILKALFEKEPRNLWYALIEKQIF